MIVKFISCTYFTNNLHLALLAFSFQFFLSSLSLSLVACTIKVENISYINLGAVLSAYAWRVELIPITIAINAST
jgi:hypothetical protein